MRKPCTIDGCEKPITALGLCPMHYWRLRQNGDPLIKRQTGPVRGTCTVPGCSVPHFGHGMCAKHWERHRKYGDVNMVKVRPSGSGSIHAGYLRIRIDGHPLASKRGYVYMHRKVLFEAIGGGAHPCWNCGQLVTWDRKYPKFADGLVVDHIDRDRMNNTASNLRASCSPCNAGREH